MVADHHYIDALPPHERPVARVWANMPDDEFKARVGPMVDGLDAKMDAVLAEMRKRPPPTMSKRAVASMALIGGALVNAVVEVLHRGLRP